MPQNMAFMKELTDIFNKSTRKRSNHNRFGGGGNKQNLYTWGTNLQKQGTIQLVFPKTGHFSGGLFERVNLITYSTP